MATAERTLLAPGRHPISRRPVGFSSTWRELSWRQKVKAVLALGLALASEFSAFSREGGSAATTPLQDKVFLVPILLVTFFFAFYLGLTIAQVMFPFLLGGKPRPLVNDLAGRRGQDLGNVARAKRWEANDQEAAERRAAVRRDQIRADEEQRRGQGRPGW